MVLIELPSISISGGFVNSLEEKYAACILNEFKTIPDKQKCNFRCICEQNGKAVSALNSPKLEQEMGSKC